MATVEDLALRLKELGAPRVLDLNHATHLRGLHVNASEGVYYFLPPPGMRAAQLQALLDEYRDQDVIHLAYNAQSALEIVHKPLLPLDSFAERYFGCPTAGVVKVTAVARYKVEELRTILSALQKPFDPQTFPGIDEVMLTQFKPPAEGRQTTIALKIVNGDWRAVNELEESIKFHIADSNLIREILITRHGVKGLQQEVILSSTDVTTDFVNRFMVDLARYLEGKAPPEVRETTVQPAIVEESSVGAYSWRDRAGKTLEKTPAQLHKAVLEAIGETLKRMPDFRDRQQTFSGKMLLIEFPSKGITGLGGHFGRAEEKSLKTVYQGVRKIPDLSVGWQGHYSYDSRNRMLTIRVGGDEERTPDGWKLLS